MGVVGILSVLVLIVIGTGVTLLLGWNARPQTADHHWVAAGLSGMFKDIAGTLAGFTITAATFLGTLSQDKEVPALAAAVGLLLLSFLVLMSTAMSYSSTPSTTGSDPAVAGGVQAHIDLLANASYFIGTGLGWLALRPLLQLIGLPDLANAFTWLLLVTALAGSARLAALTYRLSTPNLVASLSIPLLGFGLPALFWLIMNRVSPGLLPRPGVLQVAVVAFAVSVAALALQTAILLVHGHTTLSRRVLASGHRIALGVSQAAVLVIAFTWLAVATS
jgi:hypothetical protein